jgi:hypothetical protein
MGRLNDLEVLAEVLRHRKVSIQPPTVMLADQLQQGGEATQLQFGKRLSRMVPPLPGELCNRTARNLNSVLKAKKGNRFDFT